MIRKTKKKTERDMNILGGNTFRLLKKDYNWVIKKRFAYIYYFKVYNYVMF